MQIPRFQKIILDHYKQHGRRNLPWKLTRDPYKILVSEIMLQQTQVSRVLPKYEEFLKAFPTVQTLARAPQAKLLKVWQGLGYWRRAKFLQEAAKTIVRDYKGKFPRDPEELQKLPGIGPYTAGAVACFAFNNEEPFIDTNIRRVYLHFFFANRGKTPGKTPGVNRKTPGVREGGVEERLVSDAEILKIAQRALYTRDPRTWHYSLFDYGATALKDKSINRRSRHYTKQSTFEGSFRSFRTIAVQLLLAQPKNQISHRKFMAYLSQKLAKEKGQYKPQQVIEALLKDKLITATRTGYKV